MNYYISKIIGARIRTQRKNKKMSIQQLSKLLGISQQHQSRHELGDIRIHVDTLYAVAEIFNIDINDLMCDFTEKSNTEGNICKNSLKHQLQAELLLSPDQIVNYRKTI
ncbi:helix-turn-helix domain-containing protein [Providencia sp. Je.9.19]|uniref:helix-turn-helix domain-containing protein n=1 Tax=unclassified Providencia TaxID=2633465 RepID=UPI003DA9F73F